MVIAERVLVSHSPRTIWVEMRIHKIEWKSWPKCCKRLLKHVKATSTIK